MPDDIRTFTLEQFDWAMKAGGVGEGCRRDVTAALLKATPEAPVAKAEAKTCEPALCSRCSGSGVCDECDGAGRPLNPSPVTPSPWLPMGRHPGGKCSNDCGKHLRMFMAFGATGADRYHWCSPYCRERGGTKTPIQLANEGRRDGAKAQRGAAQGAARAIADLPADPVAEKDVEDAVKRSRPVPTRRPLAPVQAEEKPAPVAGQPGVPEGYRLGEGWIALRAGDGKLCWGPEAKAMACDEPAVARRDDGRLAVKCFAHALLEKGIVPVEPSRPIEGCTFPMADPIGPCGEPAVATSASGRHRECERHRGCLIAANEPSRPVTGEVDRRPKKEAPGKPDKVPLSEKLAALGHEFCSDEVAGLEAKLGAAEHWRDANKQLFDGACADAAKNYADARAQLATRDARIAGLESSGADLVKRAQEAEDCPGDGSCGATECTATNGSYCRRPAIAPPAPSNHPGPGKRTCVVCRHDEADHRKGPGNTECLSRMVVRDGEEICDCPEFSTLPDRATGKADEAPLSYPETSLRMQVEDLRAKLAEERNKRLDAEDLEVGLREERDDLRAQLATRDARIAGLEASAADLVRRAQEAEHDRDFAREQLLNAAEETRDAVTAERGRCLAWWDAWVREQVRDAKTAYEGIASGAPAPSGKP